MEAFRVTAAFHDAAGELVDDLHFAVHNDIILVAMEQELGLQGLLQVVRQRRVGVKVVNAKQRLDLLETAFRRVDGALRLVHVVVFVELQPGHNARETLVRVGSLRASAGDDQRGAGFVDENGVDLVDDGEMMSALHARRGARDHVVAQIVETELGVRAVRHVRLVCGNFALGAHAVLNQADLHAQETVDTAHPFAVAASKVVVDRDDVDVLARQGIQVARQRRDERLAFAGLHLGNLAVIEGHAADQLHVEVSQPRRADGCLANCRERFGRSE